jgi:molybdopterin-guanine dinucleotide biosynthesis protein B
VGINCQVQKNGVSALCSSILIVALTGVVARKAIGCRKIPAFSGHFGFFGFMLRAIVSKKLGEAFMSALPVVVLAGISGTGKTTFLEKLIRELKKRKLKVGTIKHDVHGFEMDQPGKDTWRHAQAGADAVAISSPSKVALVRKVSEEMSLDQVTELMVDVDIVLVEGYKRSEKPKIEIQRMAISRELLCAPEELIAVVSDGEWNVGVPLFDLEDASGVAALLVKKYNLTK